jgi:hypothetical protein
MSFQEEKWGVDQLNQSEYKDINFKKSTVDNIAFVQLKLPILELK